MIDWFNDNGVFLPMINDVARNRFYKQAIDLYCPNKRVIDVGCGTGLLSILAAKAGAKHVLAVEIDKERAKLAKDLVSKLNLQDKITVINDDFHNVNHAADIAVSETIGGYYFDENIKSIARHARKLGCDLIPGKVEIRAVAFDCHPIFEVGIRDNDHGQYIFDPGISDLEDFTQAVNHTIKSNQAAQRGPMGQTNLFQFLSDMPYIELKEMSSKTILVDLCDESATQLSLPTPRTEGFFYVALFFKSIYGSCTMQAQETRFDVPFKRMKDVAHDMLIRYVDATGKWWIDH